jgi:GNAT superfamily N-acetyltransferase
MNSVTIRQLEDADIPVAARLMESMWVDHGQRTRLIDPDKILRKPATDYIARHRQQGDVFFVAIVGVRVVGVISGEVAPLPSYYRYDQKLYLDNLSVKPEWRGKGIAGQLIEACENYARDIGISVLEGEVWKFNDASRSVFTRREFQPDLTNWSKIL